MHTDVFAGQVTVGSGLTLTVTLPQVGVTTHPFAPSIIGRGGETLMLVPEPTDVPPQTEYHCHCTPFKLPEQTQIID